MSLMKQFYTDPYLHIRSFAAQFILSAGLCMALYYFHSSAFYHFHFSWRLLWLVPLGIYVGGISAVWIHNATHGSFTPRWLNWWCGNLAGMHQLWGFMGWKLIHLIHHHYSDDALRDPHPPKGMSFWQFSKTMFLYSSVNIRERYREHWGLTRRTRLLQRCLLIVFIALSASNLLMWYLLLGPGGFVFFYVPSYVANHLLFCHINYRAHPADVTGITAPANLNHNLYYKLANALWSGIYFHGNHHRKPLLFNPRYMPISRRRVDQAEELDQAA